MIALIHLKDLLALSKQPNAPVLLWQETEKDIILFHVDKNIIFKAVYKKPEPKKEGMNVEVQAWKDKYLEGAIRLISIETGELKKVRKSESEEVEEEAIQEEAREQKILNYQSDSDILKQAGGQ